MEAEVQPRLTKLGEPLADFQPHLTREEAANLGKRWQVLRNTTRLQILDLLNRYGDKLCVSDIAAVLDVSSSAISGHLRKLREVELVEAEAYGTYKHYRLRAVAIEAYRQQLDAFNPPAVGL